MDDRKVLNDDNLNRLDFIKQIDTYSIVEKEFNRRNERKKVFIVALGVVFMVALITTIVILSKINFNYEFLNIDMRNKFIQNRVFLKFILEYYVLSSWALMLFVVLITERRKVGID